MSETREQYRERLAQVNYEAYDAAYRRFYEETVQRDEEKWEHQGEDEHVAQANAAEAVAAQVLRDVLALIDSPQQDMAWCQECGGGRNELIQFAAERGIDLEEGVRDDHPRHHDDDPADGLHDPGTSVGHAGKGATP